MVRIFRPIVIALQESARKLLSDKRNILIILIFIFGMIIRLYQLGIIPPGLNQDEASIGYDTYSLLNYGIDRNGYHNPVILLSWGSGQNALYAYLSMPFVWLFGLSAFSIRLLNAVMGTASILFMYLLVKKILDKKSAMIAMFLMAICPYFIIASRWGLESNLLPPLLLMAVYYLYLAFEKPWFFPLSGFLFALCMYAYGTSYFFVPLFLIIITVNVILFKKIKISSLIAGWLIFAVVSIPIMLHIFISFTHQGAIDTGIFSIPSMSGTARFLDKGVFFNGELFRNFIDNFKRLFDILFIAQTDNMGSNTINGFGYLYLISNVFLVFGLVLMIRDFFTHIQEFRPEFPVLIWFFLSLIMGGLVSGGVVFNHVNILFTSMIILITIALKFLLEKSKLLFRTSIALYACLFFVFLHHYFFIYPNEIGPNFFESYGQAIQYAVENSKPTDTVYVSDRANMPYIFVLFYGKVNTIDFVHTVKYQYAGSAFQNATSFLNYQIGGETLSDDRPGTAYVFFNEDRGSFQANTNYTIKEFKRYSVALRK